MAIDFEESSSQYVTIGTTLSSLQNVTGATICAWVNMESQTNTERYITMVSTNGSTSNGRASLTIRINTTAWRASGRRLDADGVSTVDSASAAANATLTHLATVLDYTGGSANIYVNGALSNTLAVGGWAGNSSNTTSDVATIGARGDAGNNSFFDGIIDDARIYSRALSANEVNSIYIAKGRDSIINGLVHRFPMNESTAGNNVTGAGSVKDKGSGTSNGTPTNTPIYATSIAGNRRRRAHG